MTGGPPIPIGVFVGTWLPYSETFVHDQIVRQERFRATVCARSLTRDAGTFPYERVVALGPAERMRYLVLGRSPTFSDRLRRDGVRLIHAHFGTNGTYALGFAEELGCPLVVTFHGHDVAGLLPSNRFTLRYFRYQLLARRMLERASLLVCSSQELADVLVGRLGAPEARIRVHRLGIDLARFRPVDRPEGPPRLLMVGRLVEKKGFEYGLRAFAEASRGLPDVTLHIVGDGPLAAGLRRLARELGIEGAVRFTGALDPDGVRGEMERAHVLVAPSVVARDGDRESGVIVLKEAAATGLPTVGTRHGGIPEIIDDGRTGFLVPEREVEPLARALRSLVRDGSLRSRMGAAARERMEREYDTVVQNRRLEDLLEGVL
jgi:colanic acid/amylovoran biosynthesis glycosyltransferase